MCVLTAVPAGVAIAGKLVPFETPKKFALVADTFSPENEMLTAAMKIKCAPTQAAQPQPHPYGPTNPCGPGPSPW